MCSYVFLCTFFFLDEKEPKNQECRITSGRHSTLRSRVVTFLVFIFLVSYLFGVAKQAQCYRGKCVLPISIIKHAFIKL